MKQLEEVALCLRNLLPKVSDLTLYDIDDILYPNEDLTNVNTLRFGSKESSAKLNVDCVTSYLFVIWFINSRDVMPVNYSNRHILDETCLQILEHSPTDISDDEDYVDSVITIVERLMKTKVTNILCLTLKILKLALKNNKQKIIRDLQEFLDYNCIVPMVQKLLNIPEVRSHKQRRMRSWLSVQASYILDIIDLKTFKFFDEVRRICEDGYDGYSQQKQQLNSTYLKENVLPLKEIQFPSCFCDSLYSFLMTAKTSEQRLQRLKEFLTGIWPFYRAYPENVLRAMEKMYGCEIEDYLTGVKMNAKEVLGEVKSELNDIGGDNFQIPEDEEDYTIERFIFFDTFKKDLQLLNIIHSASMKCQELLQEIEGDGMGHDSRVFRDPFFEIIYYFKNATVNPENRGPLPWVLEVVSKTCPFLILPKRYEYLMEDLLKLVKGEEVDEYVEEEIYFAMHLLNHGSCYDDVDAAADDDDN